ncbi:hypothetical protein EVAR_44772_1 [Eumeta japonica]|uniref:Uncharacterized protein n=1 Tax=Eumeta variegata TaxID=151549 RepID=A0A4C1Y684_EUMVA|nr:hypothetical protein EVAR_44772_1 [Eumeta japonica]
MDDRIEFVTCTKFIRSLPGGRERTASIEGGSYYGGRGIKRPGSAETVTKYLHTKHCNRNLYYSSRSAPSLLSRSPPRGVPEPFKEMKFRVVPLAADMIKYPAIPVRRSTTVRTYARSMFQTTPARRYVADAVKKTLGPTSRLPRTGCARAPPPPPPSTPAGAFLFPVIDCGAVVASLRRVWILLSRSACRL